MFSPSEWLQIIDHLDPLIGVVAVVVGSSIAGWFQLAAARRLSEDAHRSELEMLRQAHTQNLDVLKLQAHREDTLKQKEFEEADNADRLLVIDYVDMLVPRLAGIASIGWLGEDNRNPEELQRYRIAKEYIWSADLDPAHPEKTLGVRVTFLMFQFAASMRRALNARWTRPISERQRTFLIHWEKHFEPAFCSGRYPGKEMLYREQLEVITEKFLIQSTSGLVKPMNWAQFCERLYDDSTLKQLTEDVTFKLRFIFDETQPPEARRAMQCRLAILALYLVRLSQDADDNLWDPLEGKLWTTVRRQFAFEMERGWNPQWYVYKPGDASEG